MNRHIDWEWFRYILGNVVLIVGIISSGAVGLYIIYVYRSIPLMLVTIIVFFAIMAFLFWLSMLISSGKNDDIYYDDEEAGYDIFEIPGERITYNSVTENNYELTVKKITYEKEEAKEVEIKENIHYHDISHLNPIVNNSFVHLNDESELHRLGYTVSKSVGHTDGERQRILFHIIDTGKMSEVDVIRHLKWNISRAQRRKSWETAKLKYIRDLKALEKYIEKNRYKN